MKATGETHIRFTASDSASAIARAEYSLDAGEWTLVYPAGRLSDSIEEHYEFSFDGLSAGEHTIAVRVYDRFENVTASKITFHSSRWRTVIPFPLTHDDSAIPAAAHLPPLCHNVAGILGEAPLTNDFRPNLNDVREAQRRIAPHIHRTPVMTSESLNEIAGAKLFFKCENLQLTGSFKMRGATNAVFSCHEEEAAHGVVTPSSGNHGAALVARGAQPRHSRLGRDAE